MDPELPHIAWRETPPPPGMPVTQVYVWALDPDDGRILIQDRGERHRSRYNLPGGRPEPEDDGDPLKTAVREALEESQIHIDPARAVYLGYQEITEDPDRPGPYAQLRYAVPIIGYDPIGPDPDTADGRVNRRYLVSLEHAPELLGWGEHGVAQAKAAFRAGEALGFPVAGPAPDGYRDGEKHRYLVCHDYGMGGLWWWVHARSATEIRERVADVVVVTRPETINRFAQHDSLEDVDIDAPAPNPLTSLMDQRAAHRGQPGFGVLVGRGTVYFSLEQDEEIWLLEVGADGYRTRQVLVRPDGSSEKTDDWPFNPPFDLYDPQFGRGEVGREVFETAWDKAELPDYDNDYDSDEDDSAPDPQSIHDA